MTAPHDAPRTDERAGLSEVRGRLLPVLDWAVETGRLTREEAFGVLDAQDRLAAAVARAEAAEAVLREVRAAFDLQCPPMPPENYVDRGAWMAHSWWNTVLGSTLRRAALADVPTSAPTAEA